MLAARTWDHPRIRGEKPCKTKCTVQDKGSPPHTRGKGKQLKEQGVALRITPAYAGKSTASITVESIVGDHPRIRGEKAYSSAYSSAYFGSPPHTRGKVTHSWSCALPPRITPAYAGKRLKKSRNYAVFGLPVSAIHSVCDRAQAPGNSLATPCGRIVAPEKDDQPGLQVYSQRHHPPCAGPDQADRGSG